MLHYITIDVYLCVIHPVCNTFVRNPSAPSVLTRDMDSYQYIYKCLNVGTYLCKVYTFVCNKYSMWQNQFTELNRWLCMASIIQWGPIYVSMKYDCLFEWYICLLVGRRQRNDNSWHQGEHVKYSSGMDIMRPIFCLVHQRTVKACVKWAAVYVWRSFIDRWKIPY